MQLNLEIELRLMSFPAGTKPATGMTIQVFTSTQSNPTGEGTTPVASFTYDFGPIAHGDLGTLPKGSYLVKLQAHDDAGQPVGGAITANVNVPDMNTTIMYPFAMVANVSDNV